MDYNDYIKGTADILEESKKETKPYTTLVADKEFMFSMSILVFLTY